MEVVNGASQTWRTRTHFPDDGKLTCALLMRRNSGLPPSVMLVSQQHFQARYPGCSAGPQNLPWATLFPQHPQGSRDSPAQGRIGGCQVHGTPCHGDGPMGAEYTAGCTLVWGRTHGCHVHGWVTLVWSKTHRCHACGRVHPGKGQDPRVPHAWQGDLGMEKEPQVPSAWQGAPSSGAGPMGAGHIVGCTPLWDSTPGCQAHGRATPARGPVQGVGCRWSERARVWGGAGSGRAAGSGAH